MLEIAFQIDHRPWKKLLSASQPDFKRALQLTFDTLELPKRKFTVAVTLIDDVEMQKLNAQYRGKDKPTNVLSFPLIEDFASFDHMPKIIPIELGDIVLAYETTAREAKEQSKTFHNHVTHLLVHGLLHLFGHDHMNKTDAAEMEKLEIVVLAELGIENPY